MLVGVIIRTPRTWYASAPKGKSDLWNVYKINDYIIENMVEVIFTIYYFSTESRIEKTYLMVSILEFSQ